MRGIQSRRLRAEPIGGSKRIVGDSGAEQPPETDADLSEQTAPSAAEAESGRGPTDEPTTDEPEPEEPEDEEPDADDQPVAGLFDSGSSGHGARTAPAVRRGRGCLAVLVALAVLVVGGFFVWNRASGFVEQLTSTPDYSNANGAADVTVTVPDGAAVRNIGERLERAHVVKSTKAFNRAVKDHSGTVTVRAGSYRMRTKVPAKNALHRLLRPSTYRVNSTARVTEGLRLSNQISSLAKQSKISKKSYRKALADPKRLDLPTWAKNRPQGFLFPDSYEVSQKATATSMLDQMTDEFTTVASELNLSGRAKKMSVNRYQIVIVASLIEAEVKKPGDRAKVARVIYNRLAKKKPLQLDSTVHYAAGRDANPASGKGKSGSNKVTTTAHERASRSSYNTYKHKGLPPRPISSPGKAALKAAANPAKGKWLYFVSVNPDSGKTAFTSSAKRHHKNVVRFQKWCKTHHDRC